MKKIYLLLIAVVTISLSSFAQTITDAGGNSVSGNYIWGTTAQAGASITFNGNGFTQGDIVNGNLTIWSGWAAGAVIYGSGTATADANGDISGTIVINSDAPVGAAMNAGNGYMVQLHVNTTGLFSTGVAFVNIPIEVTQATDIDTPVATGSVYVTENTLNIKDAAGSTYEIFDLSGSVVEAGTIEGSSVQIPLSLTKGIYIVKVGNTTSKISL